MSLLFNGSLPVTLKITVNFFNLFLNKGNNKITELRAILQRESQNS
jgi:hypothetical protein